MMPNDDDTERNRARALTGDLFGATYSPMQEPTPRTFNEGVPRQFTVHTESCPHIPDIARAQIPDTITTTEPPRTAHHVVETQPGKTYAEHIVTALRNIAQPLDVEPPRARNTDPDTSHTAATAIKRSTPALHREVRRALGLTLNALRPGLTTHGIAKITGIDRVSISPRMLPLESLGHVYRAATETTPEHPRPSIVWALTEKGIATYVAECLQKSTQPRQTGPT